MPCTDHSSYSDDDLTPPKSNPYAEVPWRVRLYLERELGSNIHPPDLVESCRDLLAAPYAAPIWLQHIFPTLTGSQTTFNP